MNEPYIDCAIIGGGIFGSIIAKRLRKLGIVVVVIDNNEPMAGSKSAACLMKPSWYSSMGSDLFEPAMEQLHALYKVQQIEFATKLMNVTVDWIDPISILQSPDVRGTVKKIKHIDSNWNIYRDSGNNPAHPAIVCKYLILAAGVWSNKLLFSSGLEIVEGLSARTGSAFRAKSKTEARIHPFAPYRQLVKFNISPDTIWIGDGTTNINYGETNFKKSLERCANFAGLFPQELSGSTGHRPYVKDCKSGYIKQHAPNLWVVTGGAKNGTIAAGLAAHRIGEMLC